MAQTDYGEPKPNYVKVLKTAVAIWRREFKDGGSELYAYSLAAKNDGIPGPWRDDGDGPGKGWSFVSVLPPGAPVSKITNPLNGNRFTCEVAGMQVTTSRQVVHE